MPAQENSDKWREAETLADAGGANVAESDSTCHAPVVPERSPVGAAPEASANDDATAASLNTGSLNASARSAGDGAEATAATAGGAPHISATIESAELEARLKVEPLPPGTPERIADYRIVGVIGAGGMGAVYEAIQDQPRRAVALKVMKEGITSKAALRRFEYEVQILGRLRHPGIAQIYEAGMHDDGTGGVPYFAMEFITDAKTIVDYAKDEKLTLRGKLDLFAKICDAVHHGHQKGIIHRDLKPANILVDASGQPKVIDFGVARTMDAEGDKQNTMHTQVGQLVGTVQFMSPEQIEADPDGIDTRSDVYALGVILYLMLTGRLPYNVSSSVIYEATRIIREQPPKRMSSLDSGLKGDVETIVCHALEKDKTRRYQSAAEFALDIRRFLGHEPIQARPPSVTYVALRFAQRNQALVTGAAAVLVALVLGIVGTTNGMIRAQQQREIAQLEARVANAVEGFLADSFANLNARESGVARGDQLRVVDLLDSTAEKIETSFHDLPEAEARLRVTIGNGYRALTMFDKAEEQLGQAVLLFRRVDDDESTERLASALKDLGSALWFQKDDDQKLVDAEKRFKECLRIREQLFPPNSEEIADAKNYLAACVNDLGENEKDPKRIKEAEGLYREALAIRRSVWGANHEMVGRSVNNLATCLRTQGEDARKAKREQEALRLFAEAETLFREAVQIVRATRGDDHIDVANGYSNLGHCLSLIGKFDEGEQVLQQALDMKRRMLRDDNSSLGKTMEYLAKLYEESEQPVKAEPVFREHLYLQERRNPDGGEAVTVAADWLRACVSKLPPSAVQSLLETYRATGDERAIEELSALQAQAKND